MNTLTIVVGLPRSGKSAWIEKNKGNAIVVSNDWIREHILGCSYSSAANAIVWSITDATLRIVLGQGHDAILDGINHTVDRRSYFIDIARQYGAKVKIVHITTPLSVCMARNNISTSAKLPKDKLISFHYESEFPTKAECDEIIEIDDCYSPEEVKDFPYPPHNKK